MFWVIDNVIGNKYSQRLFDECCNLKWSFYADISYGTDQLVSPGFAYTFFLHEDYNSKSSVTHCAPEYNYVFPMLLESLDKAGLPYVSSHIFRSRARLMMQKYNMSEEERVDVVHRDYNFSHMVILYYVNTTDGDTLIYDQMGSKIVDRVTPKRGRVVMFDGSVLHASTSPSLAPRIVINSNVLIKN